MWVKDFLVFFYFLIGVGIATYNVALMSEKEDTPILVLAIAWIFWTVLWLFYVLFVEICKAIDWLEGRRNW